MFPDHPAVSLTPENLVRAALILGLLACHQDGPAEPCSTCPARGARIPPSTLIVWQDTATSVVVARPAVDSRAVYFLGYHQVSGVDKTTGAHLWTTTLTYPGGVPFLNGYGTGTASGLVIIGDIDLFGLDPTTGTIVWRFSPSTTFPGERTFDRLATDASTVYIGGVWGNVYAVDAESGAQRWVAHVTTLPDSNIRVFNPVVTGGVVYVAFTDDRIDLNPEVDNGGAAAIDAATGQLLWSQYLPHHFGGLSTETRGAVVTPTRVVVGARDGFLYGLDRQTGVIADTIDQTVFGFPPGTTQGSDFTLATMDTVVVAGTLTEKLMALDARNLHRVLWSTTVQGSVFDVVADSSRVYVANGGTEFTVDVLTDGKPIWWNDNELRQGELFLEGPAVDAGQIYWASDHAYYAFKRR